MAQVTHTTMMLVDDHEIMRDGLREVLQRSGGFQVVGEAGDGVAAVRMAQQLKPDVVIMDVMMPRKNGIEACRDVTEALPNTSVLIRTAAPEEDAAVEAVTAGAVGYLQKYTGKGDLLRSVRAVAAGQHHIPPDVLRRVLAEVRAADRMKKTSEHLRLTQRDREILALFAQGLSYAKIAEVRGNQPQKVRTAIDGIQDKLSIETKQELVFWAVRNGLLDD